MYGGTVFDNVQLNQDRKSKAIRCRYSNTERISFHSVFSGTPEGTMLIQISNDLTEDETLVVNWVDYTGSLTNILGVEQFIINVKDISFRWIRVGYIFINSDGIVNTTFSTVKRYQ